MDPTVEVTVKAKSRQQRPRFSLVALLGALSAAVTISGGAVQIYDRFSRVQSNRPDKATDARIHYLAAVRYFNEKDRTKAITEANASLAEEPRNAEAQKLIGACYGIENNMEAAAGAYRQELILDPHDSEAMLGLATALDGIGDREGAHDAYLQVVDNPDAKPNEHKQAQNRLVTIK